MLFQIDECPPDGNFVFTKGPEANTEEANGILDNQDFLVFMAREAQDKAPENRIPPGAGSVVPVELRDPSKASSKWAYLVRFDKRAPNHELRSLAALSHQGNEFFFEFPTYRYKAGPVRIIIHSTMYPRFPLGIKGPGFFIDSILVDTLTLTTTTIRVPFNPGTVMHRMKLALGMDLTPDAKGMVFYNSENREGFRINGRMDGQEKACNVMGGRRYRF